MTTSTIETTSINEAKKTINDIALKAAKFLSIEPIPKITLSNDIKYGQADLTNWKIKIPRWVTKRGITYLTYYVAHEVAHFARPTHIDHGPEYKEIEGRVMKEFGLKINYANDDYIKEILDLDGNLLYKHSMRAFGEPDVIILECKFH